MPDIPVILDPTPEGRAEDQEINRLRARIRDLQAELARRPPIGTATREGRSDRDSRPEDEAEFRGDPGESKRRGDLGEATADIARDLPVRVIDEASKLVRGFAFAGLEQFRVAAGILNTFTDEVFSRNQPDRQPEDETHPEREGRLGATSSEPRRRTVRDLATALPGDMYSAFVRALDRSLDSPSAAVERFHSAYKQAEREAEATLRKRRRPAGRESTISDEPGQARGGKSEDQPRA